MRQHYRDNIHLLTYGYDAAGRTNSLVGTLAGVTKVNLAYQWDNANRLTRITDSAGNHRVDFAYTLTGDYLTLTRYGDTNGTQLVATSSYAYDNADRLTSLIHALGSGGGTSLSYALAYDANNQITSITSGDGVNNFTNDNNGQETSASLTSESYSYDATGNRTTGGTVTGADNRVSQDSTYTYSYDNEGNLTLRTRKDGSGSDTFAYDYRNRLTSMTARNGSGTVTLTATYAYDAFDRRIRRTLAGSSTLDEQYLYDGTGDADVLLVADGAGNVTLRQLNGPGCNQVLAEDRISGTTVTTRWALSDHEGTVRDVVDHSGTVVDHLIYGSYGNITSQSNAGEQMRATYTGAPTDSETGFVYLHHRYYNPTTGRWMSQDPLSFGAGDVNLYRYVGNGPMNGVDPSGLCTDDGGGAQSDADLANSANAIADALSSSPIRIDATEGLESSPLLAGPWQLDSLSDHYSNWSQLVAAQDARANAAWQNQMYQQLQQLSQYDQLPTMYATPAATWSDYFWGALGIVNNGTANAIDGPINGVTGTISNIGHAITHEAGDTPTPFQLSPVNKFGNWSGATDLSSANSAYGPTATDYGVKAATFVNGLILGAAAGEFSAPVAAQNEAITQSVGDLRSAGLKDAHHVIQDAAVRDLPGYNTNAAPGVQLEGPSTSMGSPHYNATQVQRLPGGGTYGAEAQIGHTALRAAGFSDAEATQAIQEANNYFNSIGVNANTLTRIPGNR